MVEARVTDRDGAAGTPLRVGLDARMPDASAGGVQQFVIGLASGLSALDDSEDEYLFLSEGAPRDWMTSYLGPGQGLITTRSPDTRPDSRRRALRRWVGDTVPGARGAWRGARRYRGGGGPELARSDGAIEAAGVSGMHFTFQGAFLTSVPSIYQPWDLQHIHIPEFFTAQEHEWRDRAYGAFSEQARIVVVTSEWGRRDVVANLGVSRAKVAVIGVPPAIVAHEPPSEAAVAEIAARLRLMPDFVYYPAQAWPHKNHLRLLAAMAELRDRRGLKINLVCSGGPNPRDPAVRAEVRRLGLGDAVQFVGFIQPTEVQALYRLCRALVFPSLFEGWGFPILEAFAIGVPVMTSNVTSLPELVDDAALVVDPTDVEAIADAMARLWQDSDLRAELVARGRPIAAGFDWPTTARSYRALYRAVAGRPLTPADQALVEHAIGQPLS